MLSLKDGLNIGQEIFLVVFSILYGVMLQSVPRTAFPWGRIFRESYAKRRVSLSIFLLNILPFWYFWTILVHLKNVDVPLYPVCIQQVFNVISVFWFALGVFGFHRLNLAIMICNRCGIYTDMILILAQREVSDDVCAHLFASIVYLFPFLLLLCGLSVRFISRLR